MSVCVRVCVCVCVCVRVCVCVFEYFSMFAHVSGELTSTPTRTKLHQSVRNQSAFCNLFAGHQVELKEHTVFWVGKML